MTNMQECLSYLSDIDFDRETLKAAREELAYVAQRANGLPADVVSDTSWNAALEAAAHVVGEELAQENGWIQQRIRALKRTT